MGNGPTGIAFGHGAVWVVNSLDGTVSRIDPETNAVAADPNRKRTHVRRSRRPRASGSATSSMARWFGSIRGRTEWLEPLPSGTARKGVASQLARRSSASASQARSIVAARSRSGRRSRSARLDRLRGRVRPALVAFPAHDGRRTHRVQPSRGSRRNPARARSRRLAADIRQTAAGPTPSSCDGASATRTGRPVKASDFRRGARALPPDRPPQCRTTTGSSARRLPVRAAQHCDLSRGIVADDAANTVTFHLVKPDPEFLYQLAINFAYAVPAATPPANGTHPLPATGPYMIASYRPNRESEIRSQPVLPRVVEGCPAGRVSRHHRLEIGGSIDDAIDDVVQGKADLLSTLLSGAPGEPARSTQDPPCAPNPHQPVPAGGKPLPQYAPRTVRPVSTCAGH